MEIGNIKLHVEEAWELLELEAKRSPPAPKGWELEYDEPKIKVILHHPRWVEIIGSKGRQWLPINKLQAIEKVIEKVI